MADEIDYVLDDEPLRQLAQAYAEKKAGLIFFVGSGPSTEAKLPDWSQLRARLTQYAEKLIKTNIIAEQIGAPKLALIKGETDYWRAFSLLREVLGATTFPQQIAAHITPASGVGIPAIYMRLAEFELRGVITTNIDELFLRAFSQRSQKSLYPVFGKQLLERLEIIQKERPFFLQLHGNINAQRSWVLTKEDLDELLLSKAHATFLRNVFFETTVVFIGISPEDVAVSGRLIELRQDGIPTVPHYWITSDAHTRKRDWAEANGIRQIVYPQAMGHSYCLNKLFDFMRTYKPKEREVNEPIIFGPGIRIHERDPAKLAGLEDEDKIRETLNGLVLEGRDSRGRIEHGTYTEICKKYRRAVAAAYLMPDEADAKWFGYDLQGAPLGGRTFGNVYSGLSASGEVVAIKMLRQLRAADRPYLESFRRGAEALKLLERYNVHGVARLREAYELPPTLVMEFVNGSSLKEVIEQRKLSIDEKLKVMQECAAIIRTGHQLPLTVLHRDIRPSNIMLRGFDWQTSQYDDVVMFDFDLGWYRGAYGEVAVISDVDVLGYRAPEQLNFPEGSLQRSTLVDSFGLGATLYFCVAGIAPTLHSSGIEGWARSVEGACRRALTKDRVAAKRCARLILNCTAPEQRQRPDFSLIEDAFEDVLAWREGRTAECSTEFIAEALVALSTDGDYTWDDNRLCAYYSAPTGMSILGRFDAHDNFMTVEFKFEDPTNMNRRALDQRLSALPAFVRKEADRLGAAQPPKVEFTTIRHVEGWIKWSPEIARGTPNEIGTFTRKILTWMDGL